MSMDHRDQGASPRTEIHVGWLNDRKAWMVTRGGLALPSGNFRRRAYALAFARAIASSRKADMVVRDENGEITRHAPDTLSYPRKLD